LACPPALTIKGCNISSGGSKTKLLGSLAYSEALLSITLAQLQAAGGDALDDCEIASITYRDTTAGSCPNLVVIRTFTVTDRCGNIASCQQLISFIGSEPLPDLTVLKASSSVIPFPAPIADLILRIGFIPTTQIANIGTGSANNIEVAFLLNGSQVARASVSSLAPGQSVSVSPQQRIWVTPNPTATLRVIVDPSDRIAESNELNNVAEISVFLSN